MVEITCIECENTFTFFEVDNGNFVCDTCPPDEHQAVLFGNQINQLLLAIDGVPETLRLAAAQTACTCAVVGQICEHCEMIRSAEKLTMAYNSAADALDRSGLYNNV